MNKIKLFCLPFAGGSAAAFNPWKPLLGSHVELQPVELAGRGRRIREPLYNDINDAINDCFNIVNSIRADAPYALYGHSMGSVIAFELAYKMRDNNLPEPVHIFFSGRGAPHMPRDNKPVYHLLEGEEFRQAMIKLGGTANEFWDHPELVEVFLPLLKNDLRVNEGYRYRERDDKLDCPITILNGLKDADIAPEEVEAWQIHTNRDCSIHNFPGGHFFLNEEAQAITRIINDTLRL